MSRLRISAVFLTAFVLLAVLVDVGVFHGVDEYAVRHWMPWLAPQHHPLIAFWRLLVPQVRQPWAEALLNVWVWPASVLVSAVIVVLAARRIGVWIVAVWIVVDLVELVGKLVVERPSLYTRAGVRAPGFEHSLPSGHTLRAFVVALAVSCLWRRGWLAFLWAATVPVALVVTADHVPTDVVASLLLFAAVAAAVRPWAGSAARAAASGPAPASSARASR